MQAILQQETRLESEDILRSYRTLDALIASAKLDVPEDSLTANYDVSESKRVPAVVSNSFQEKYVIALERLQQRRIKKQKLDYLYESIHPIQKAIWDLKYTDQKTDIEVRAELHISRRYYDRKKTELLSLVAEAFYL